MTDYCLKFSNAAAAHVALGVALPGYSAEADAYRGLWAVDRIGALYSDNDINANGDLVPGALLPGYHVNLRVDDSLKAVCDAGLAAFVTSPATPRRVWS